MLSINKLEFYLGIDYMNDINSTILSKLDLGKIETALYTQRLPRLEMLLDDLKKTMSESKQVVGSKTLTKELEVGLDNIKKNTSAINEHLRDHEDLIKFKSYIIKAESDAAKKIIKDLIRNIKGVKDTNKLKLYKQNLLNIINTQDEIVLKALNEKPDLKKAVDNARRLRLIP